MTIFRISQPIFSGTKYKANRVYLRTSKWISSIDRPPCWRNHCKKTSAQKMSSLVIIENCVIYTTPRSHLWCVTQTFLFVSYMTPPFTSSIKNKNFSSEWNYSFIHLKELSQAVLFPRNFPFISYVWRRKLDLIL